MDGVSMAKKDDAELLQTIRERFQEGSDADRENRDAGKQDLEFLAGDQWDPIIKELRSRQGRPCLMINRLPAFVAQVVGDIRINRPAIKVRPAEDGDEKVAETRQGLIRAIEHDSGAQDIYADAGMYQTICGVGNFRVGLEYAREDAWDQDIRIRAIDDPFAVVWDPLSIEPTGKDAKWCFIVDEWARKDFEAAYPDAMPTTLEVDSSDWSTADTVRVTEYWVMKETKASIAMLEDGRTVYLAKGEKGAEPMEETADGPMPLTAPIKVKRDGSPMIRETVRRSACMYLTNGTAILEKPYELPIDRLPVFRVQGWVVRAAGKRARWGLVRFAKDPQRLYNFDRSVIAETLAMAPRTQWIAEEKAVQGVEDDFRHAHRTGDPLLIYKGANKPERQDPPQFPAALAQSAAMHAQDIKDVTGLHDASLGVQSNETSGKAILARDRQGDVATYIYPDRLKGAIAECGRVINMLIPVAYDTARTVRILGEDETSTPQRINDPMDPAALDILQGRYDVVVETGPSYSTKRVEAAESMMQFVQAVPGAAQFAGDLIAKAQDWPMADEIGERLKRAMPPQITQDPNQPPPPPDPAQQAAMQMQQAAAQLALRKQQAEVQEAEARVEQARAAAVKAQADAQKAMIEADKAALAPLPVPDPAGSSPPPENVA